MRKKKHGENIKLVLVGRDCDVLINFGFIVTEESVNGVKICI